MNADTLLFFNTHPLALPLYEKLERRLLELMPETEIGIRKTQISFSNKRGFGCVSFTPCRRAAQRPPVWMTVSFGLAYRKASQRIDGAVEPYPGRWTHHVLVGSVEEIDDELLGWLCEAAAFSAAKR
ncbi:MAG: hypothetical protein IJE26_00900 [Oscillospiraceae bacterium]|nr:hypothetical protein [Oscillospiraceae bacterium]